MKIHSLILVEGDTEEEFYKELGRLRFAKTSKRIKNLHGNFSINQRVIDAAIAYSRTHSDKFNVYVCIDRERVGAPALNVQMIEIELRRIGTFNALIPVIADLMIESLFFIDIVGIYKHLRAPSVKRNPKKYAQFRTLTHRDLSKLFKQFDAVYCKGIRCRGFISALDLRLIATRANELRIMIDSINR